MKPIQQIALHNPLELVAPACLLLATLAVGYILKRLIFRALHRWGDSTSSKLDEVLTKSLATPIMIWSLILGIYFATESLELPERFRQNVDRGLLILVILCSL